MLKKLIKQTIGYSLLFGVVSLVSPVAVAASDATKINLYGINTGIIPTEAAITDVEVVAIVASIVVGGILIANGKLLKRVLKK